MIEFDIVPQGPFSWPAAVDVLRTFPPLQRHWRGQHDSLPLTFLLDGDFTPVSAVLGDAGGRITCLGSGTTDVQRFKAQVARIFSLDRDGAGYPAVLQRDARLAPIAAALPGLRPVCFTSPYECAAWAVMSQRISMRQTATALSHVLEEHGHGLTAGNQEVMCFPEPERLLKIQTIPGLNSQKVDRLHGVARAALAGILDANRLRTMAPEEAAELLRTIPGIGPFWASGIYLRAAGISDVFPAEPLSIAALGRLHGLGDRPAPEDIDRLTSAYRPFRMWVCFLLRVAADRGLIPGVNGREGAIRRAAA